MCLLLVTSLKTVSQIEMFPIWRHYILFSFQMHESTHMTGKEGWEKGNNVLFRILHFIQSMVCAMERWVLSQAYIVCNSHCPLYLSRTQGGIPSLQPVPPLGSQLMVRITAGSMWTTIPTLCLILALCLNTNTLNLRYGFGKPSELNFHISKK